MEDLGILQQISQALGSAAGSANSAISDMPGGYFTAGSMALGGASDIASTIGRYQVGQAIMRNQQILGNPKKLMAFIQGVYQPMTQAEQEAIGRDLNAVLATQGTTSGGYAKEFIAKALAGIERQRFQAASQTAISGLQGSPNIGSIMPQGGGALAGILQQLAALRGPRKPPGMTSFDPSAYGAIEGFENLPASATMGVTPPTPDTLAV